MRERRSQTILLIGITICGGFIVVLSFMNWVELDGVTVFGEPVDSFTLNGTEISRIQGATTIEHALEHPGGSCTCRTDFGDGYLIAILGALVLASASANMILRRMAGPLVASVVVASLAAFAIAGYNATGIWQGAGFAGSFTRVPAELDGDVRGELIALTTIAALSTLLGTVVFGMISRDAQAAEAAEWATEEDEPEAESAEAKEVNGWA